MTQDEKVSPSISPIFFPQELSTIGSMGGLQEIAKTYREVMLRNDETIDQLFNDPRLVGPLNDSFGWSPEAEDDIDAQRLCQILSGHLRKIIAFMSGLGIAIGVDITKAESKLSICNSSILHLKGVYNRWRIEQSNVIIDKLRDAIGKLSQTKSS